MSGKHSNKSIARYLMEDLDQNWFSFFSGVLANIPISIFLMMQKHGVTTLEHLYFYLHLFLLVASSIAVWFAFKLTIIKIQIENQSDLEYEKWVLQNKTTSKKAKEECLKAVFLDQEHKVKVNLLFFCIFCGVTFVTVTGLWVLNNYI